MAIDILPLAAKSAKFRETLRRFAPGLLLFVCTGCSGDPLPTSPTSTSAPALHITGKVADGSSKTALFGVTLTAADGPNAGKTTTTGPDGRYTLGNLVSGAFTLRASTGGYEDHVQEITITSSTNIDIMMTPTRTLNSGWTGGTFFAVVDGRQFGFRMTRIEVTQSGRTVSGAVTGADGSSATFTGLVTGSEFFGSMRAETVSSTTGHRCIGGSGDVRGTMTPEKIALTAPALGLENCTGAVTNVSLTLTP